MGNKRESKCISSDAVLRRDLSRIALWLIITLGTTALVVLARNFLTS